MMKKAYLFLIIFCSVLLSGCSSSQPENSQDAEFLSTADDFIAAFNSNNTAELDKYIDREYGFFVIHNPGAYIVANYYDSFSDIMSKGEDDVLKLKDAKFSCPDFRRGLEPTFSCDDEKWNKEGCFYGTQKNYMPSNVFRDMTEYDLVSGNEIDPLLRKAELSEKNYAYFIYNTNDYMGFYFGLKNGKYYLITIDTVVPCSA